jgi:hypothetical protein
MTTNPTIRDRQPMTATARETVSDLPDTVCQPKHALYAMTTFELKDYRRQLQRAIEYFSKQDPVPAVRADLQAALDGVIAEQDDRKRLADA